ncbi:MAG: isochorismate synthase [Myxococcales bacterium]|nr:isochorismate synthase [Myxococcales bacterium]MDH3484244.1 isochorismate synthase [Myxococcales bacterium]
MRSHGAAFAFEGVPTREASRGFLEEALGRRSSRADLIVTVPAPVAPPDALLRAFPHEASILWDPPQSAACSGLGVAATLAPTATAIDNFFADAKHVAVEASPVPRVFGGASFAPGAAKEPPWESFGDGFLILPTWTYHVDERAWLSLAIGGSQEADADELLDVFDAIWDSLERPLGVIPSPVSARRLDQADRDGWSQQVEEIRDEILAGAFRKIVAARHCVVELETGAGSLDVLERLEERFPGCTRFAFWRGDAAFLGATPELLIARRGAAVRSEALAGSTAHGDAARMMASKKEQEEHQLVVRAVLRALEPYCDSLRSAPEPSVRELPNVLHMQTPIEGRLREPVHVLALVQALHPTPAVGGVPTREAINWIVDHEELPRGWYSAPVGWTDANGDGEFFVALRSGLLRDGKAWVYAGAGIMADSDPDAEYAETELKMQALLGALHGDGR